MFSFVYGAVYYTCRQLSEEFTGRGTPLSNKQYCYIAGNFLLTARVLILRGHMASNNETVSRQNL